MENIFYETLIENTPYCQHGQITEIWQQLPQAVRGLKLAGGLVNQSLDQVNAQLGEEVLPPYTSPDRDHLEGELLAVIEDWSHRGVLAHVRDQKDLAGVPVQLVMTPKLTFKQASIDQPHLLIQELFRNFAEEQDIPANIDPTFCQGLGAHAIFGNMSNISGVEISLMPRWSSDHPVVEDTVVNQAAELDALRKRFNNLGFHLNSPFSVISYLGARDYSDLNNTVYDHELGVRWFDRVQPEEVVPCVSVTKNVVLNVGSTALSSEMPSLVSYK